MRLTREAMTAAAVTTLVLVASGCSHEHEHGHGPGQHSHDEGDEHDRDGGEHGGEGEESGDELRLDQSYDAVRHGARLVLDYDAATNAFTGTVENTTAETLERVRVEVHLSNGKELGPTEPVDLAAGEKHDVELVATSTEFDGWTAHPEVGSGEHGHGEAHGEHEEHGDGD